MSFSSLKPTSSPRPRIRISKRSIPRSIGANPLPDTAASVYLQVTRGRAYTVYLLQNGQSYNAVSPLVVEDVIG